MIKIIIKKMKWCIGLGKIYKNLYILLIATLFKILSTLIYGINDLIYYEEPLFKDSNYSVLKNQKLFQSVMRFFGIAILSFAYSKYKNLQKKNINSNNINFNLDNSEKSDSLESISEPSKFILIHNEVEVELDNTKDVPKVLFIGFLLVLVELAAQFYNVKALPETDFWTFEILFTGFFMVKIFKIELYIHQIFSICFIVILCSLMKVKLIYEKQKDDGFNSKLFFILCYIFILVIKSYVYTKIKWLMDIRYITIPQILFLYGLFGFFISLVICILASIFIGSFWEGFIDYNFLPISIGFGDFMKEIGLIIAYMCFNFFTKFYYMKTLETFTPIHVLANDSFYYLFIQIVYLIFQRERENFLIINYVFSNIFSILGYVIYVELIELKFCGCDYNLKKNITKRSRSDAIESIKLNKINLSGEKIQTDGTESDLSEETSFYSDLSDY